MKTPNKPLNLAPAAMVFRAVGVYSKRLYWPFMLALCALDAALFISISRMPDMRQEPSAGYCTCSDDTNTLATVQAEIDQALSAPRGNP